MSERDRAGGSGRRELGRRLRLEAALTRPAFSPAFQERIIEAAVREHASDGPRRAPRAGRVPAFVAAVACIAFAAWLPARGPRPAPSPPVAAAVAAEPSLDDLPSLEEIGDEWAEGTAALAAEAVGLPRWNELVDAGRFVVDPWDLVPERSVGPGPPAPTP